MADLAPIAIGLDIGTIGLRAVAVGLSGKLIVASEEKFPANAFQTVGCIVEQDPLSWTIAAQRVLRRLISRLPDKIDIVGIAVDATSGTFLFTDANCAPLTPGIMYNDLRGSECLEEVDGALSKDLEPYGIKIVASFALPKIVHLLRKSPELIKKTRRILHQTDWLVGMLCGRFDVTDISTALKTGAHPEGLNWPPVITNHFGISSDWLPEIVMPGTPIGKITKEASSATGLDTGITVVSGYTDGTAGFLASGAKNIGDMNTTLGTTLVFKGISAEPPPGPAGNYLQSSSP